MGIIFTIFIGLIIGALAKLIMPGNGPGGIIVTILLGIAGAVVATWIGQMMGLYLYGEPAGFIASVLGALLILFIFRMARGKA